MNYKFDFTVLWTYSGYLAEGLIFTVYVALPSIIFCTILGLMLASMQISNSRILRYISIGYVDVFRTIPVICLLFWVHYVLPILTDFGLSSMQSAILAMTLSFSAFASEAFRGGFEAIPSAQKQAALSLGFSPYSSLRYIIVPQALFSTLPAITNVHIMLIKTVPMAVLIAVPEIMFRAQELTVQYFRPLEIYTGAAAMYVALVLIYTSFMRGIERLRKWETV